MLESGNLWYMMLSGQYNTPTRIEQGLELALKVGYFDVGIIGGQPAIAAVLNEWDDIDHQNYPVFIQPEEKDESFSDWNATFLTRQKGFAISAIALVPGNPVPAATYYFFTTNTPRGSQIRQMVFAQCPLGNPAALSNWNFSDLGLDDFGAHQSKFEAISIQGIPHLATILDYPSAYSNPRGVTVFQANGPHPQSKTDWNNTCSTVAEIGDWQSELVGFSAINGRPAASAITGDGIMYAQSLQDGTSQIVGWETTTVSNEIGFWKLRLAEYKGKPILGWLSDQVKDPDEFFGLKTKYSSLRMAVALVTEPKGPDDWNLFELESGDDIDNFNIAEVDGELAVAYSYETNATKKFRKWGFLNMDYEECEYEMRYVHTSSVSPTTKVDWQVDVITKRDVDPFNPKLVQYKGEPLVVYLADDWTTFKLARPIDEDSQESGWSISEAIDLAEEDF